MLWLFALSSSLLASPHAPATLSSRHAARLGPRRHTAIHACADDDSEGAALARELSSELRRRQATASAAPAEPFTGVREIVLDADGNPQSIPKRAPPERPDFAAERAADMRAIASSPLFRGGVLASIGAAVVLLLIANADAAASA